MKEISMFTDGACKGNPGPGGWGVVFRYQQHEKKIFGAEPHTTNNRMELTAIIKGFAALKEPCRIKLTTDSQYVKNGVTLWMPQWKVNNWRTAAKKQVKNIDLWQELDREIARHEVKWHWVKGHSGHLENEMADELANLAIDKLLKR